MVAREKEVAHRLMGEAPFGQVAHVVGWDKDLSDGAFHTYYVLCCRSGKNGKTWITEKKLAQDRGKGLSTVQRHLKELREAGLVETQRRGFNRWDKCIVPVAEAYKRVDRPYASADRIRPLIIEGARTLKNEEYIEEEKGIRKPDPSDLGTQPSGLVLNKDPGHNQPCTKKSEANVIDFQSRVQEMSSEGREMVLRQTRHPQETPRGKPDKEPAPRGQMTDPEGNVRGPKKEAKTNPTRSKIRKLWPEWKALLRGHFNVDIPGQFPAGADYGHLKNVLNYVAGDYKYALRMLTYVVDEWDSVKEGCFRAERLNVPTLYLVDAIKDELHANIQTGKRFQPKPERKEKKGVRGVDRHQGGWEDWE